MFNPRIFIGAVATASVLAITAATPAFAAGKPSGHPAKIGGTSTAVAPARSATGSTPAASTPTGSTPTGSTSAVSTSAASALASMAADGLLGALPGASFADPLLSDVMPGVGGGAAGTGVSNGAVGQSQVNSTLHGLTSGSGLSTGSGPGSITSGFGGAVDSVGDTLPAGGTVTGLLAGDSVDGALNNSTGGLTNGALSGITNAVPGVGSVTNALPEVGN